MNPQIWWYLSRASGIVAWFMLTASVLWGIMLSTRLFPERRRPAWLLDLHRWLAGLTIGFLALHLGGLAADGYVAFGPADLLVPFASEWQRGAVALGVFAFWLVVIVQVTSLARKRLPRAAWRRIHVASYGAFLLGALHGAFAGTDATQPIYRITSALAIMAVAFVTVYRVLTRSSTHRRVDAGGSDRRRATVTAR